MGYGAGAFLLAVGLILALAVNDTVSGIDLVMVGWILAAAGALTLLLTAITLNSRRSARTTSTVTDTDGRQVVRDQRTEM